MIFLRPVNYDFSGNCIRRTNKEPMASSAKYRLVLKKIWQGWEFYDDGHARFPILRACLHEPGFRDLALPLNLLQNFRCVHMRRWAGSVPKILVFPTGILLSKLEIFVNEQLNPVTVDYE